MYKPQCESHNFSVSNIFQTFPYLGIEKLLRAFYLRGFRRGSHAATISHDRDVQRFKLPVINSKRGYGAVVVQEGREVISNRAVGKALNVARNIAIALSSPDPTLL